MGSLVGHVGPGLGFLIIGLWQLFNHTKLYCQTPKSYHPPIWFPTKKIRHLELYLMMMGAWTSILMELFIGPAHHHPLDPADFTIPSNHLHNFEHATISFSIFTYAIFSIYFDRSNLEIHVARTLSLLLGSLAFSVQFLLFYLHSTDHAGVEWQYHWLLLVAISVSLVTTIMGIGFPRSFAVGFLRSVSVVFQGIWFNILGIMLYTRRFIPKGCWLDSDDGRLIVPCGDHLSLHRAVALVNLQYIWALLVVAASSVWFYVFMAKKYPPLQEYESIKEKEELEGNMEKYIDVGIFPKAKDFAR